MLHDVESGKSMSGIAVSETALGGHVGSWATVKVIGPSGHPTTPPLLLHFFTSRLATTIQR